MVGVVGRVPLDHRVDAVLVDGVEVRGVLGVHPAGQLGVPVEQAAAVHRREEPLVRIDRPSSRPRSMPAKRARADGAARRRAAVGGVDVEPQAPGGRHLGRTRQVVDDPGVGGAGGGDHGDDRGRVRVGVERGGERRTGEAAVVAGGHHERDGVHDPQGAGHRRVGLVAHRHPHARRAATALASAGRLAGHDQRREVAGRASRHEAATRLGRQAGEVGQPAQGLVLGVDRARRLEPRRGVDAARPPPPGRRPARAWWGRRG